MRCIAASVRNEKGVMELLANHKWLTRVLLIIEEWKEDDVVANACKIVHRVTREDLSYDRLVNKYPNMGNFLLGVINKHQASDTVVHEATSAFKYLVRK